MAKTIKFNLICDGNPVRTIDDLRNNFSIEDVLEYYENGLLQRWLRVRGYEKELEAVLAITAQNSMEVIKKLIGVFEVDEDIEAVEKQIYMLQYLKDRKNRLDHYEKEGYKATSIIADYENGYHRLVQDIVENPNNAARIKAAIKEIVSNYAWVLELNNRELFYFLKDKSTLAIMCLLMNEKSRSYYIPEEIEEVGEDGTVKVFVKATVDQQDMYDKICKMIQEDDFVESLGENICSFSGITNKYWKDLEPKGKRCMIIRMGSGDLVRGAGIKDGEMDQKDIWNKFVILDGIDYVSDSDTRKLIYMEV